jgi:regulatory helix-turn-helix LysR family protein
VLNRNEKSIGERHQRALLRRIALVPLIDRIESVNAARGFAEHHPGAKEPMINRRHTPRPTLARALALDWEDVRCFIALAHHGTTAAAARALRIDPGLVEQRLASLEATLGETLFTRGVTRFDLTSAGATALADAAQMEMGACALMQKRASVL